MKIKNKIQISIIRYLLSVLMLCMACEGMRKELEIDFISFPPKLSVTAILDAEQGIFTITLREGRALADYSQPFSVNREIISNGEIRLFEDGELILTITGRFDMSVRTGNDFESRQNGFYRSVGGIEAKSGSVYSIEVEVEGYPIATASSVMPSVPIVSASIDTSTLIVMNSVKQINSLQFAVPSIFTEYDVPNRYWPVTVSFSNPDATHSYYALEQQKGFVNRHGNTFGLGPWGLGVSDMSVLIDNPHTEGFFAGTEPSDLYIFPLLVLNNPSLVKQTFYVKAEYMVHPYVADNPEVETSILYHYWMLRIKHITQETFRNYRSHVLQGGHGFFSEPVNILGNINNGYGNFTTYNSFSIIILEWETLHPADNN